YSFWVAMVSLSLAGMLWRQHDRQHRVASDGPAGNLNSTESSLSNGQHPVALLEDLTDAKIFKGPLSSTTPPTTPCVKVSMCPRFHAAPFSDTALPTVSQSLASMACLKGPS
ncbi:MAG: hypothetical protein ACPIOQ_82425, partial [Promethearchaeia archaeon]